MEVICGSALYSNEFRTFQDYPSTALGDTVKMTPTGNVENTCCAVHSLVDISSAVWRPPPGRSRRAQQAAMPVMDFLAAHPPSHSNVLVDATAEAGRCLA
jgi:hypothetical protein